MQFLVNLQAEVDAECARTDVLAPVDGTCTSHGVVHSANEFTSRHQKDMTLMYREHVRKAYSVAMFDLVHPPAP